MTDPIDTVNAPPLSDASSAHEPAFSTGFLKSDPLSTPFGFGYIVIQFNSVYIIIGYWLLIHYSVKIPESKLNRNDRVAKLISNDPLIY